ncbi:MAG: cytochrome c [Flavobacteriales bacterium]|nr:cytochrome c [Flavobacteriales bacterium]
MVSRNVIAGAALLLLGVASCSEPAHSPGIESVSYTEDQLATMYTTMCAICHGADGKLGNAGATDLASSTLDLQARIAVITYGKGQMTPFNGRLTEQEIAALAQYIESFRE